MTFVIKFLTFMVAYSPLIPISLYVAMGVVKMFQGSFITYDDQIYDYDLEKASIARTSDLIEELGQVEFIFSDKTGTLTQNLMEFRKCCINSKVYGSMIVNSLIMA
jgi:P-type E1-E2 ATPase